MLQSQSTHPENLLLRVNGGCRTLGREVWSSPLHEWKSFCLCNGSLECNALGSFPYLASCCILYQLVVISELSSKASPYSVIITQSECYQSTDNWPDCIFQGKVAVTDPTEVVKTSERFIFKHLEERRSFFRNAFILFPVRLEPHILLALLRDMTCPGEISLLDVSVTFLGAMAPEFRQALA